MRASRRIHSRASRHGTAMVAVGIMVTTLATMSLSFLAMNLAASKARRAAQEETGAMLVAETGLSEAVYALERGQPASLGTNQQPLHFGGRAVLGRVPGSRRRDDVGVGFESNPKAWFGTVSSWKT